MNTVILSDQKTLYMSDNFKMTGLSPHLYFYHVRLGKKNFSPTNIYTYSQTSSAKLTLTVLVTTTDALQHFETG